MRKRLLSMGLVITLVFSLFGCGSGNAVNNLASSETLIESEEDSRKDGQTVADENKGELKAFKLGMIDPGAWNATAGPLYAQMETACKALNVELVLAAFDTDSAEGHLAAIQNLLSSGCDAIILLNKPLVHGIIPQVAQMCDEAGVYWSLSWTKLIEGEANYEAAMNSEYFVSTTYEDDVYSAYWCAKILGQADASKLTEIGFVSGNATGDMRDQGVAEGCDEFGMELMAEERDTTLTKSSDGGKTIMDRFIAGYPEMDGILIAGMSQYVLSGVVSAIEENSLQDKISVSCIDFHEFQAEYLESGILDGIIGGHVVGPFYSLILISNIMNGTPLTDEKMIIQDNFIELSSYEDALIWEEYGKVGNIYSEDEIKDMVSVNNPDFNIEVFNEMISNYSLVDIVERAEK